MSLKYGKAGLPATPASERDVTDIDDFRSAIDDYRLCSGREDRVVPAYKATESPSDLAIFSLRSPVNWKQVFSLALPAP